MKKLIKLSDTYYIAVNDSEIKEDDWYWTPIKRSIEKCVKKVLAIKGGTNDVAQFKITHSTELLESIYNAEAHEIEDGNFRKVKPLSLSEVEEAINGYSVEKMADERFPEDGMHNNRMWQAQGFVKGFKAHQELVKDKLFTVEDMMDCFNAAREMSYKRPEWQHFSHYYEKKIAVKTEWDIEINEQGKITFL